MILSSCQSKDRDRPIKYLPHNESQDESKNGNRGLNGCSISGIGVIETDQEQELIPKYPS